MDDAVFDMWWDRRNWCPCITVFGCTGVGSNNDWTVIVDCKRVGGDNDWTIVVGCTCNEAVENLICSEAAESISSASAGLLAEISSPMYILHKLDDLLTAGPTFVPTMFTIY